ncbi:MAG: helicase HerA domain-containing protein [Halobellus sp.]|uniref:helicase HerA domain-containing protein n=1 Tax=Halobellus sp. TaxID=1979212 RepID=UPI0035D446DD
MTEETETIAVANVREGPGGDGTHEPGASVDLPVVDILTGRGFITGKSGSGKSNTASVVIENLLSNNFPVLIVDTDGEYYGLKEQFELLHAGADEECDIVVSPEHAEKLANLALEQNVPIILDVSGYLDDDEAQELLTAVARHLFAKEKKLKKPFVMLVEECHEYIPEGGGMTEAGKMLIKIGKRGRKHGLGIVGISQRPADVKKDFITQCDWLVWHRLTWNNDTKVVGRILGSEYADAIEEMDDGEAFLVTDWSESLRRVRFHKKQTFDAGATPGLEDFERPDLKSVDGDLVSELQDISDEKARRESEIADLKQELEKKDQRIRQLERELEEAQDLSQMADQFAQAMFQTAESPYRGGETRNLNRSEEQQAALDQYDGDVPVEGSAEHPPDGATTADEAADADDGDADADPDPDAVTAAAAGAYPGLDVGNDVGLLDSGTADLAPERAHEHTAGLTGREDVVERLRKVVASLPPASRRMLAFYREIDACDPVDAHVAAGEVGDKQLAYSRNGPLRRAGFVEHVGRGRYAYALPNLVRSEFADRLSEAELREVVAAVESAFRPELSTSNDDDSEDDSVEGADTAGSDGAGETDDVPRMDRDGRAAGADPTGDSGAERDTGPSVAED